MNDNYVYVYLDRRKPGRYCYSNVTFLYQPFYIGKGSGDRIHDHVKEATKWNTLRKWRTTSQAMYRRIRKIIRDTGNIPIYFILKEFSNEKDAYKFEEDMVKEIGRKIAGDGPLMNITCGGRGGQKGNTTMQRKRGKDSPSYRHDLDNIQIEIITDFINGMTLTDLSKKYHADKRTLKNRLKTIGLTITNDNANKKRSLLMTNNNPMKNKNISNIVKLKNTGHRLSDKTRKKMSESRTGKASSKRGRRYPDTCKKMIFRKNGEDFIVTTGLLHFCQEYNLNYQAMADLRYGKRKQFAGFISIE